MRVKGFPSSFFSLFVAALLLAGCDSEALQSNEPNGHLPRGSEILQIGGFVHDELDGDPFELKTARFDGNDIVVDVAYSGGCAVHGWQLFADEAVALSMPPQLALYMVHDDADDDCEAYPSETLRIDASALIDWLDSPFIVHLVGVNSISETVTMEWGNE
jgi:hypothetical protein